MERANNTKQTSKRPAKDTAIHLHVESSGLGDQALEKQIDKSPPRDEPLQVDTSSLNAEPLVEDSPQQEILHQHEQNVDNFSIEESFIEKTAKPEDEEILEHEQTVRKQLPTPSNKEKNCEIKNLEKRQDIEREKEIQICIQEIRSGDSIENFNLEQKIQNENMFVMEIEPEETSTSENKNKRVQEQKKHSSKLNLSRENVYKHVDFLSDDEEFVWSSSSWQESSNSDIELSDDNSKTTKKNKKKKKSKRSKNTKKTLRNIAKENSQINDTEGGTENETNGEDPKKKPKKRPNKTKLRSLLKNSGEEYITKTGKVVEARKMKENPCKEENCPNECYKITEERRQAIFYYYWNLDNNRRKDWLVSNTKKERVKRPRVKGDVPSRRQWTYKYFINEGEGRRTVCLRFFINTLDIQQKFLHITVNNSEYGCSKEDLRGKRVPPNKTSDTLLQSVRKYIGDLPALPSHYSRKNSKKFYLPLEFKNLNNLYHLYKKNMINENHEYVGEKVFKNIFKTEFNISFHVPRKDKCIKCIRYENDKDNEALKEEKNVHLKDKEETYTRFGIHQDLHKQDKSILCTTFDLQKVLNTPYGESMLFYYSRKLAVYNLTFYESGSKEGYCFTWNESEGKRGANEICTVLEKYIKMVDERKTVRHLLLYSDSCPGQNKNKIVLACLNHCLKNCKFISSIQMNYLLPGHTYMPVDSMHSLIERSVSGTIIYAPSQWPTAFSLARKLPSPYHVEVLTHTDFFAWDACSDKYFKSNLVGKISKIRVATFKKSTTTMCVKYSMSDEAETETIDIIGKIDSVRKAYKTSLPISKKKYADLVKLCTTKAIPEMYHQEFIGLPNAGNVHDTIPESDIEDDYQD